MTDGRGALLDTVPVDEERGDAVRVWCRLLGQAPSQPLTAAQQRLQEQRWRALRTDFMAVLAEKVVRASEPSFLSAEMNDRRAALSCSDARASGTGTAGADGRRGRDP